MEPFKYSSPWVFLDLETKGLAYDKAILEVHAIHVDPPTLAIMSEFSCILHDACDPSTFEPGAWAMHAKEGPNNEPSLLSQCALSQVDLDMMAYKLLLWLAAVEANPGRIMMAGNSIGNFDMQVLKAQVPLVASHFHHRVIDVSSVIEMYRAWCGPMKKASGHRARPDCILSLDGARWMRSIVQSGFMASNVTVGA